MPGIFDLILGRNQPPVGTPPINPAAPAPGPMQSPSVLDAYSTRGADTLMGLSQGLLAAGGPSQYPVDFLSAIGKGVSGGLAARESGEDKGLKRALTASQVQKAQADIANEKLWQDMFKGPGAGAPAAPAYGAAPAAPASPQTASAVPGGGPSNPTNPGNLTNGQGGFQTFPTPEAGVAAAVKLAQSYPALYNGGQPMSLAQMEAKWAPPDNGKDPLTKGNKQGVWSGNIARVMGVDPNQPIDFSNPAVGQAFAQAVHVAEHGPAKLYAPDVYGRGVSLAYGNPQQPGGAAPANANGQGDSVPPLPGAAPNPVQQAQYQPPVAASGGPPAKSLPQVIQELPPALRQMMGAMPRKDALPLLMKYADPETHVAIDTQTGQVVFAPKTDSSGRYQPVDAMKLDLDKQRLEVERRQAAARERAANTGEINSPIIPGPGGQPILNPVLPQAKAATAGAEAESKVPAALREEQGKLVIKDIQLAQTSADHARVGSANFSRLGALLDQVNTNKFAGTTLDLKAAAKAAGIDMDALGIADNVGVGQAAKALSQQLALQLRDPSAGGGMPGSMSDADRQFLTTMVPAITNDPNANKLMLEWQKKLHQRNIEIGKIVNEYGRSPEFLKDPTGVYAKVREYADKNPLFDPEKDAPKATSAAPAAPPMSAIDAEIARRRKMGAQQ